MNKISLLIFGLLCAVNLCSGRLRPRIINGADADIKEFPWMASIRIFGSHLYCGGGIITRRHILTAGHCAELPAWQYTVHTGVSSTALKGNLHHVARIFTHPQYKIVTPSRAVHDIAIFELEEPIEFDETQMPMDLPTEDIQYGSQASFSGWGETYAKPRTPLLQKLNMTVLTREDCDKLMTIRIIDDHIICAFSDLESGPCYGDSGSPLIVDGKVVGIASNEDPASTPPVSDTPCVKYPLMYTKVFDHLDFIRNIISSENVAA